jgi:hypothetical protein
MGKLNGIDGERKSQMGGGELIEGVKKRETKNCESIK